MQSNLLTHAMEREFPALSAVVSELKKTDDHFLHLLTQHDALDAQITKDEVGMAPMGDAALEDLKKQRLLLKDELYRIATAAQGT